LLHTFIFPITCSVPLLVKAHPSASQKPDNVASAHSIGSINSAVVQGLNALLLDLFCAPELASMHNPAQVGQ
jgi:hypothetical protein